jgi:hypothetical protein
MYDRPRKSDCPSEAEWKAAYMRSRYQENALWMRQYKIEQGCKDCGYNKHHAGLEFDHREPRVGRTVAGLMGKSLNRIKEEIAKCDVVCGICHRIRTWNRLQESRSGSSGEEQLSLKQ